MEQAVTMIADADLEVVIRQVSGPGLFGADEGVVHRGYEVSDGVWVASHPVMHTALERLNQPHGAYRRHATPEDRARFGFRDESAVDQVAAVIAANVGWLRDGARGARRLAAAVVGAVTP